MLHAAFRSTPPRAALFFGVLAGFVLSGGSTSSILAAGPGSNGSARGFLSAQGESLSAFSATASVTPARAPIGDSFDFQFTVTNVSTSTASFSVDGCPVHILVDGVFSPFLACPLFIREIVLAPGESVTFGPDQDSALHIDPHEFALGPGPHRAHLWIPWVAEAGVEMQVEDPDPTVAYAAGQVVIQNYLRLLGSASLVRRDPFATGVADSLQTPLGPLGHFLFDQVEPGWYLLRVDVDGGTWWYPGTQDPALAKEIELPAGVYVDGLRMELPPPPPPPWVFPVSGSVFEACPECGALFPPLAGALVLAVPVFAAPPDSSDSTTVVPGDSTGVEPMGLRTLLNPPEPVGRFFATTDEQGLFQLELPQGSYRILAGRPGTHRYQYWNHVASFEEAGLYPVPSRIVSPRFDLPVGENLPAAIEGQVLAYDPLTGVSLRPLEGALVEAIPILPTPLLDLAVLTTHTGPDGTYRLEVPSHTPYRVAAHASGYESRFYQFAMSDGEAQWVDVAPGTTTAHIDFQLPVVDPGAGKGAIAGVVLRRLPGADCPASGWDASGLADSCFVPAAGALVRVVPAYPTFAPVEFRTFTGPDGRFLVDGLPADPNGALAYFVSAQIENSEPAFYPGGVPFPEALPLPVYPGTTSNSGAIVLGGFVPGGHGLVAGRVTDPEDHPLLHATVRVYVDPERPEGRVARALTNENGEFLVDDLPAGIPVLVSAEAQGYVPAYFPGVNRWQEAERVTTGGPNLRVAPLRLVLVPAASGGPFIQAGLVVVERDSAVSDTGWVEPQPLSARPGGISPGSGPISRGTLGYGLLSHDIGVRDAFFYLVNAAAMGPTERAVAGTSSGDNGAAILTGLPGGEYIAYADRPGYERAYFQNEHGKPFVITLMGTTPAVLARIELRPLYQGGPEAGTAPGMVTNLINVPNPFHPQTAIRYVLKETRSVTAQVFDQSGRLVRTLVRDDIQDVGEREVIWDGRDDGGRRVSPGIYFTRIQAGPDALARKMVLLP